MVAKFLANKGKMEAVPQQDQNLNLNPSRPKSEDSSSKKDDSERSSPPPNCAICLGKCSNNSFTDTCLHQFCFNCLLTWSKVKAECPLCKQAFKSIIYNVQSNFHYDQYHIQTTRNVDTEGFTDFLDDSSPRGQFRTTVTLPPHTTAALHQIFMRIPTLSNTVMSVPAYSSSSSPFEYQRNYSGDPAFRRTVYQHNLWARPLPDVTGRFRECTPNFYSQNGAQVHRLIPWINRELNYLMNRNVDHIAHTLARVMDLLFRHSMDSEEFAAALRCYLGDRSDHFVHELRCFAATPYDLQGYDRNVQYAGRPPPLAQVIISSSESDSDSVTAVIGQPVAGPSRLPPRLPPALDLSVPIETISHSDTDDDNDDVMVIGYIKPPQERTPEVVDLLETDVDSDVIIQDDPAPHPPVVYHDLQRLVKVSLRRHRAARTSRTLDTDSDDEVLPPARTKMRRRRLLSSNADSTEATNGDTPPPRLNYFRTPSPSESSEWTECGSSWSSDTKPRKRKKAKSRRRGSSKKSRHKNSKKSSSPDRSSSSKQKSVSGKGVKSSKKSRAEPSAVVQGPNNVDQPTTSDTKEHKSKRSHSHESKRLRSVVTVRNAAHTDSGCATPPYTSTNMPYTSDNTSVTSNAGASSTIVNYNYSDSDDDIPLNLTINRIRAGLDSSQCRQA